MIDKQTAYSLALEYLNNNSKCEIAILDDQTTETEYGWIFAYDSKKWVETRIGGYRIVGNIPILVEKLDGSIFTIYEGLCPEATLEEYLEQKRQIEKLRSYRYLNGFLSGYMKQGGSDKFSSLESAIKFYVGDHLPEMIAKAIEQGRAKLAEEPFDGKFINKYTYRNFDSTEEARQWLEKVISMLESTQNVD
jgi:hypothetical protein